MLTQVGRRLSNWVVFGALFTLTVFVGGLGAWLLADWATKGTPPRSDIISLLGAFLGAAVTIGGTFGLTWWFSERDRRADHKTLRHQFLALKAAAGFFERRKHPEELSPEDAGNAAYSVAYRIDLVREAGPILEYMMQGGRVSESYPVLAYMFKVRNSLESLDHTLSLHMENLYGMGNNPTAFTDTMRLLENDTEELRQHLDMLLDLMPG